MYNKQTIFSNVNMMNDFMMSVMSMEHFYVYASFVVAILIFAESTWILKNKGKIPKSNLFAVISLTTSSWFVVSAAALFFLHFSGILMSVPVVYGVYSVMGWIYGARLVAITDIDDPMDLVLPEKYLNFCRSFAIADVLLCFFVLVKPHFSTQWALFW